MSTKRLLFFSASYCAACTRFKATELSKLDGYDVQRIDARHDTRMVKMYRPKRLPWFVVLEKQNESSEWSVYWEKGGLINGELLVKLMN